jgi:hypothetical protein
VAGEFRLTDWEADPDALVQETMALTKSIRVETPIPRTTADQDVVLAALNEAALIIGDYLELGHPRDPVATSNRLIQVLDSQKLAAAITRMEKGYGLKVVK